MLHRLLAGDKMVQLIDQQHHRLPFPRFPPPAESRVQQLCGLDMGAAVAADGLPQHRVEMVGGGKTLAVDFDENGSCLAEELGAFSEVSNCTNMICCR